MSRSVPGPRGRWSYEPSVTPPCVAYSFSRICLVRNTLRTWLAGILINCSREERKLARRYVDSPTAGTSHRTAPHTDGLSVDLDRAIGSLNDEMRTVLLLFDLEGYSHEEIAGMLGIPEGTSKSRLFVARRILRERLNQGGRNLNDTT